MIRGVRALLFILALFSLLDPAARAVSLVPAARIAFTEGEVSIRYAGTEDFVSVWRREKVGPGDAIATGPGGVAELRFSDGARVVIGPFGSLAVTGITPRSIAGGQDGGEKVVLDITMTLDSGTVRAATGPGGTFVLTTGGGTITVQSSPETGADVTAIMGVFAWGEYVCVREGCAFVSGPSGTPIPLCSVDGTRTGLRYPGAFPADVDESLLDLAFSGAAPAIRSAAVPVPVITVDGHKLISGDDGAFRLPEAVAKAGGAVTISGTVQDDRAVVISGGGGTVHETVLADRTGRWERTIELTPGADTTLTVMAVVIGAPPGEAKVADTGQAPPAGGAPPEKTRVDPNDVASRFVRAFAGALSRGDTGALSGLVSPDYNGTAGGAGRSALLRGVSEFFRTGATLSVSAYATGAILTEDTVIVTMSFSSRAGGTPRSGNLRLWLTPEGQLTHAEGDWVL
ncbi:MAG: FecR domain-containing protein [Deltaproteobacteria bacterium]|nr:FecR domain-containing protein [Candidatus Zymogenaceae bacterium]